MSDPLYATLRFDPIPIMASGQQIDPTGAEVSGLDLTGAVWTLDNAAGSQSLPSENLGAVRLAIPLGANAAALYQNTAVYHASFPTAALDKSEVTSSAYELIVFSSQSDFSSAGLSSPSVVINSDFCAWTLGTPSECTEPICQQAASSGQQYLIITVKASADGLLPVADISNLQIEIGDAIVSHISGEASIYLLAFDYVDDAYSACPSSITTLPVSKLPRTAGVSNLRATPKTQFVAGNIAPEPVTLEWDFSDGGLEHIAPNAQITIGQQGAPAVIVPIDEATLRSGSYALETVLAGQYYVSFDYVIVGTVGEGGIGGVLTCDFVAVAEQTPLRSPIVSGNSTVFGAVQANISVGDYLPSGDGYVLCQLKATGTPSSASGLSCYAQVKQGDIEVAPAVRLDMSAAKEASLSASATLTQTELVAIKGGALVTLDFQDLSDPATSECTFTWLPLGDATFTLQS